MSRVERAAPWLAVAGFVASFALPATAFLGKGSGAEAAWLSLTLTPDALGGIFSPGILCRTQVVSSSLGWLINIPFAIVAVIVLLRRIPPKWMVVALALGAISASAIPFTLDFVGFLVGYYVWCASLILMLICGLRIQRAPNPRLQRTPLRAPLSRKPLGRSEQQLAIAAV